MIDVTAIEVWFIITKELSFATDLLSSAGAVRGPEVGVLWEGGHAGGEGGGGGAGQGVAKILGLAIHGQAEDGDAHRVASLQEPIIFPWFASVI